ncbi:uncharacterized protein SCODWIG_02943 [Saccharomycodes ludwigii]|uniref:Uncharacterized protein n=1 Tax=Saccharomycodes ludwigii TaxID=36035 RepID=A0A376B952_9ASCO|nr:hypothetical protein SCDLUD_004955 [Saccharomycodes ludwigii]KAH3899510.1 hypothetical protein SCDLUD_004955 [Saccharomycodes ludwigii]SSD61182.1 uncharacterized protein SCODWIG_02943 [Saccharomycodes ludwigii]
MTTINDDSLESSPLKNLSSHFLQLQISPNTDEKTHITNKNKKRKSYVKNNNFEDNPTFIMDSSVDKDNKENGSPSYVKKLQEISINYGTVINSPSKKQKKKKDNVSNNNTFTRRHYHDSNGSEHVNRDGGDDDITSSLDDNDIPQWKNYYDDCRQNHGLPQKLPILNEDETGNVISEEIEDYDFAEDDDDFTTNNSVNLHNCKNRGEDTGEIIKAPTETDSFRAPATFKCRPKKINAFSPKSTNKTQNLLVKEKNSQQFHNDNFDSNALFPSEDPVTDALKVFNNVIRNSSFDKFRTNIAFSTNNDIQTNNDTGNQNKPPLKTAKTATAITISAPSVVSSATTAIPEKEAVVRPENVGMTYDPTNLVWQNPPAAVNGSDTSDNDYKISRLTNNVASSTNSGVTPDANIKDKNVDERVRFSLESRKDLFTESDNKNTNINVTTINTTTTTTTTGNNNNNNSNNNENTTSVPSALYFEDNANNLELTKSVNSVKIDQKDYQHNNRNSSTTTMDFDTSLDDPELIDNKKPPYKYIIEKTEDLIQNITDIKDDDGKLNVSDNNAYPFLQALLLNALLDIEKDSDKWNTLTELNLSKKQLDTIISLQEIVPNVIKLNLSKNNLRNINGIPTKYLIDLDLSYNSFDSIFSISPLCKLIHLEALNISHNKLIDLNWLISSKNDNVETSFKSLHFKRLDCSFNEIYKLPSLLSLGCCTSNALYFQNLQEVNLSHNKLSGVLDFANFELFNLKKLNLSFNFNIKSLKNLQKLRNLKVLNLEKCINLDIKDFLAGHNDNNNTHKRLISLNMKGIPLILDCENNNQDLDFSKIFINLVKLKITATAINSEGSNNFIKFSSYLQVLEVYGKWDNKWWNSIPSNNELKVLKISDCKDLIDIKIATNKNIRLPLLHTLVLKNNGLTKTQTLSSIMLNLQKIIGANGDASGNKQMISIDLSGNPINIYLKNKGLYKEYVTALLAWYPNLCYIDGHCIHK